MKIKRLKSKLLLVFVLVLGTAEIVWLMRPTDSINQETYERIQIGMTLTEVEAIMGNSGAPLGTWDEFVLANHAENILPDGRTITKHTEWTCEGGLDAGGWLQLTCGIHGRGHDDGVRYWEGARATVAVHVDAQGRIVDKLYQDGSSRATDFDRFWEINVRPIKNWVGI
jgi:hypothetical protein